MDDVKENTQRYVDKYCNKHHISPEEAKQHALVRDVIKHYEDMVNGNLSV